MLIAGAHVWEGRQDRRKGFVDAIGVDMIGGAGVDLVHNLEEPLPAELGKFDHVECVSVLEHARRPWLVAENIESAMYRGASIRISVPFVWRVHSYPSDYWRFTPEGMRLIFPLISWEVVAYQGQVMRPSDRKVKSVMLDGFPYFERTEVVGWGHRK